MGKKSILIAAVAALCACNLPPTQPPGPGPTTTPTISPTGSATPTPGPSPIAPAGEVKMINGAHCEAGSLWILPKDEEIAVAPCPPPESQPDYIEPAATRQIPSQAFEQLKEKYSLLALNPAPERLGSLVPGLPMADGLKAQCSPDEGVVMHGGLLGSCSQYLVQESSDEYRLLKDGRSFQAYFAPIESAAEAASYAIARSGSAWKSSFPELKESFRYYTRLMRRSRVEESAEGFEVLLYGFQQFGCGPHPSYAISY
ncbi:MAG TPA: hypothetical protein V6D23_21445, partial [Candidatus Obscuribacterales bacterium]